MPTEIKVILDNELTASEAVLIQGHFRDFVYCYAYAKDVRDKEVFNRLVKAFKMLSQTIKARA